MNEEDISEKKERNKDDADKLLDVLWNNLESRRDCENKHVPEYLKKQKKKI